MSVGIMTPDQAVGKLIGIEGNYVNNLKDSGGETIFGITIAVARENGYVGSMRTMPRSVAVEIYKKKYIIKPGFDKIWAISPRIAYELFDTGVNVGPKAPSTWLQEHLNLLNRNERDYKDILVDGAVGTNTANALKAFLQKRGAEGENTVLKCLNADQGVYYKELATRRPKDEEFYNGWISNRVEF